MSLHNKATSSLSLRAKPQRPAEGPGEPWRSEPERGGSGHTSSGAARSQGAHAGGKVYLGFSHMWTCVRMWALASSRCGQRSFPEAGRPRSECSGGILGGTRDLDRRAAGREAAGGPSARGGGLGAGTSAPSLCPLTLTFLLPGVPHATRGPGFPHTHPHNGVTAHTHLHPQGPRGREGRAPSIRDGGLPPRGRG